jgi:tetratricopeptide (TPR) repeat protein
MSALDKSHGPVASGLESWNEPGACDRALFFEFLAIQHFLRDERGPFRRALAQARHTLVDAPAHTKPSRLLLDALEANQVVRAGDAGRAALLYRRLATRETAVYRDMTLHPSRYLPRDIERQRGVVALLHHNLGLCLQTSGDNPLEIEEQYRRAIAYAPHISMLQYSLVQFLREQRRWDESAESSRGAVSLLREQKGAWQTLNSSLASIYIDKAHELRQATAEGFSGPSIENVDATPRGDEASGRMGEGSLGKLIKRMLRPFGMDRRDPRREPLSAGAEDAAPADAEASPSLGPPVTRPLLDKALDVLEFSLNALDWNGNSGWRGKTHAERASILEELVRFEEAARAYELSAMSYEEAEDHSSAAFVRMRGGDALARFAPLAEVVDAYRHALSLAYVPALGQTLTEGDPAKVEPTFGGLQARLALVHLAQGEGNLAAPLFEEKTTSWEGAGWGPYHDILSQGEALLRRVEVRHPVSVLYHQLLKDSADFVRDRDVTAALLKLYGLERDAIESSEAEAHPTEDGPPPVMLNVATPLVMEVSETFCERIAITDDLVRRRADSTRASIMQQFGVRMPGVRVRAEASLVDGEYVLSVHEVPLARGRQCGDDLRGAFRHLEDLLAANLVEFVGHQEAQNFLERSLLVRPILEDVAAKENFRHMDPLSAVLRALVTERVPLLGSWQFSASEIKDSRSLAMTIAKGSDSLSAFLREKSGHGTELAWVEDSGRDASIPLRDTVLRILNDVIAGSELYDKDCFREVTLHPDTRLVLSQGGGIRDSALLHRLLLEDAFPKALSRRKTRYPQLLYDAFRAGWEEAVPLEQIVENIRQVPEIRERLWGNEASYAHLLLAERFESWLDSVTAAVGPFHVLVLDSGQRRHVLDALTSGLTEYAMPALVVRSQKRRALLRALIADTCPEVPVLSVDELCPGITLVQALVSIPVPEPT